MTPLVRFAPSPTGRLHVGNVRTALINWLYARRHNGRFILRLDDTDRERSREEFAVQIEEDLAWLGLTHDSKLRQSDRMARYQEAAAALRTSGRLYPCYETEAELERRRKLQLARGAPPVYDRAALALTDADRTRLEAEGRRPHWRFRLDNDDPSKPRAPQPTLVFWSDLVRGEQSIDVGSLSDPVLIREDGTPLYTFTSVVDDIDLAVSHVIRGEDHVTNTGVQIQIFRALGRETPPAFAHHSLLVGADGQALSKRLGSLSIAGLREQGIEPMAIASHAALIGSALAIEPYPNLDKLAAVFDIAKLSRAPARFDPAELAALNHKLLASTPYESMAPRLEALGVGGGAPFWEAVRGNIGTLAEAKAWWTVVTGPVQPTIENSALLAEARRLLPDEPWDATTWGTWTNALKTATGAKGRALFHPLRLALTGREAGPEMKALLPLMRRETVQARLIGESA